MKWRISCPFCGASYSVEADVFGKQCECGKCKQRFSIKAPDPAEVVPVADGVAPDVAGQQEAGGKPFLCGVLNVIGGFAVALCGVALIMQLVAAGVEFFHPSEHSYIREEFEEFYKSVLIEIAVFFGGMVVLGISSLINRASRRW